MGQGTRGWIEAEEACNVETSGGESPEVDEHESWAEAIDRRVVCLRHLRGPRRAKRLYGIHRRGYPRDLRFLNDDGVRRVLHPQGSVWTPPVSKILRRDFDPKDGRVEGIPFEEAHSAHVLRREHHQVTTRLRGLRGSILRG